MTDERRAAWIWPRRDRITGRVTFTPELRRSIAALAVGWNTAEAGAAALATPEGQLLADLDDETLKLPLDLFMARATLAPFRGTIRNPLTGAPEAIGYLIADIPDPALVTLLRRGGGIPFAATAEDLALWQAAGRDWRGIDPKRPFGTGNVSRDLRPVLDPAKALSNAAFVKRRRLAEARLVLMLLTFVQHAELASGDYERDYLFQWQPAGTIVAEPEPLTAAEWADRIASELFYKLDDGVRTLGALRHLADDGRIAGTYADLASRYRLQEVLSRDWHAVYAAEPALALDTGLRHFPDAGPLALMRARLHNFCGEFEAATVLLSAAGLAAPELPPLPEVSLAALTALEKTIARHGSGALSDEALEKALNRWNAGAQGYCLRDWAQSLLDAERDDDADVYVWRFMQSAAAQLLLMSSLVR